MNKLFFGDCLDVLKKLHQEHPQGFIDLIYIDPPFNSQRNYNILFESADLKDTKAQKEAFADTWSNISYKDTLEELKDIDLDLFSFLESLDRIKIPKSAVSYLTTMAIRLYYMHKVLKDTGSFYLHCDPTMSHYLKVVCDLIFGANNFRNEIVWRRSSGFKRASAKKFPQKNDIILFYVKSENHYFLHQYIPHDAKYIKRFKPDENGRPCRTDVNPTKGGTRTIYLDAVKGNIVDSIWDDIYPINPVAKERLGYPTQKPEALLERIIEASSNKGDLVVDFFCGCGTTISVAQRLKRKWLGVDISHLAIGLIERRLLKTYGKTIKKTYEIDGLPKDIASAKKLAEGTSHGRLKFQDWIIEAMLGGIHNPKRTADGGWDGHLTFTLPNHNKDVVLIEAKSGKTGIRDMRNFIQAVKKQKASMGVFVCFNDDITKPMAIEAKEEGYYKKDLFGQKYDKIQIITVENLLDGESIKMPDVMTTTVKNAEEKTIDDSEQSSMF